MASTLSVLQPKHRICSALLTASLDVVQAASRITTWNATETAADWQQTAATMEWSAHFCGFGVKSNGEGCWEQTHDLNVSTKVNDIA